MAEGRRREGHDLQRRGLPRSALQAERGSSTAIDGAGSICPNLGSSSQFRMCELRSSQSIFTINPAGERQADTEMVITLLLGAPSRVCVAKTGAPALYVRLQFNTFCWTPARPAQGPPRPPLPPHATTGRRSDPSRHALQRVVDLLVSIIRAVRRTTQSHSATDGCDRDLMRGAGAGAGAGARRGTAWSSAPACPPVLWASAVAP